MAERSFHDHCLCRQSVWKASAQTNGKRPSILVFSARSKCFPMLQHPSSSSLPLFLLLKTCRFPARVMSELKGAVSICPVSFTPPPAHKQSSSKSVVSQSLQNRLSSLAQAVTLNALTASSNVPRLHHFLADPSCPPPLSRLLPSRRNFSSSTFFRRFFCFFLSRSDKTTLRPTAPQHLSFPSHRSPLL